MSNWKSQAVRLTSGQQPEWNVANHLKNKEFPWVKLFFELAQNCRKTLPHNSAEVGYCESSWNQIFLGLYSGAVKISWIFLMTDQPCLTYLGRAYLQCSSCYLNQANNYEASARHFLVTVFQKSGSCYKHIPKSWKKPNGYTVLHYITIAFGTKSWMENSVCSTFCLHCVKQNSVIASALLYSVCS